MRRIPISYAGGQCETKHRLTWTRKRVVAAHYKKHGTAWPSRDGRAVTWPREERHGRSMARAWHGKCESDTAAMCNSNGKGTF